MPDKLIMKRCGENNPPSPCAQLPLPRKEELSLPSQLHVVYMGGRPQEDVSVASKHHAMLHRVLGSASAAKDSLVHSYGRSFNGFAAKLTQEEATRISEMEGVISVNPNRIFQHHTTRSWDFMNLTTDKVGGPQESDVVIGLLDTGVWPEHPSFNDSGFGPPPAKWKGTCMTTNFTCNNKIIGARYYNSENSYYFGDIPSPRDTEGHGTHTASTASGVEVEASYFGLAKGIAREESQNQELQYTSCCQHHRQKACRQNATWKWSNVHLAGKIVFCEALWDGSGILLANGVGTIMADVLVENPDYAFSWPLPATLISPEDGKIVLEYIKSTEWKSTATIFYSDAWKDAMAPTVVSFSSRGPSPISPDILKPDITAPGVDILAGWSPLSPSSVYYDDERSTLFNIISGTSMSCPHASGAAAYVKALHPNWSPAAIKSALMTTAYVMDPRKHEDLEFAYGSGQINPVAARDPGLVFDASEADYINFLCKQGYNTTTLRLVTGDNSTCASTTPGRAWDLNYPSFSLYVKTASQLRPPSPDQ
ncbi:UNVERIFIED_CONTAM: Cucumisin [Sesamum calycinum]|uniref:Cucumisin n=1 Tax=Sesamum calycinum TaxID=2727403 RepID=A0AAW2M178_9LAMI